MREVQLTAKTSKIEARLLDAFFRVPPITVDDIAISCEPNGFFDFKLTYNELQ